jgi:hypothetical protein
VTSEPLTKNERIRRLRLRDIRNYLRGRYGHTLPDDDAGREDLRELLYPISVGPNAAIKMPKAIEIWAPWMNPAEVGELIDQINQMPIWLRKPKGRELGKRLRVTNQMRQQWGLWTIKPCDLTDEQLAEWRKARDRERKRRKRQQTRAQYLAGFTNSERQTHPWLALGIKRRAYYKRLKKYGSADGAPGSSALKLLQHRNNPVHQSKPQVSRAIHAASSPKLNINRKSRRNRTAESIAADATNRPRVLRNNPVHQSKRRPRVLRTQPVSPSDSIAGIGHNLGPPLNSPIDLPELVDDWRNANANASCAGCRPAEIDWPAAAAASLDIPTFLLRGHPDCVLGERPLPDAAE